MSTAKLSIASTLTSQLRDGILSGSLMPNTRLRLEELGARYGVSLSPVREALLRLAGEGLVVSEDQRGFRVAEASMAHLDEVTRLRAHMEPFALRRAIECGDPAWEENLVSMFHRLTRIEQRDGFVPFLDEWERTHHDFHLGLIAGCGMPMLIQFCATLHDQSDRYRRLFLKTRPPQRNVAKEHAAIMKAALDRDADTACRLLREHSERTAKNVQAFMRENNLLTETK
ncbi:DNA-binding GntR family transcriptional regulator [Variovorax boronicumulans]|uniref:GntR family transcriptional regulator n=1 Tax=Variovorax boronicumulans TaxID=436515 RepID=UPI0027809AC0|nr:FCD domain-containing protein [Variovorax boronicumulans]MDP9994575.1 DNA-binding GntR family transcriptional regulator [Variovorax boronicumulans]MDQ0005726.1 DNA-binding GntR family transcriptional regulator [Variovorax boronicumulans]MDQ0044361.1 DNA-binding GntR family transcriptional regulator [Variovorax boronicumulans]